MNPHKKCYACVGQGFIHDALGKILCPKCHGFGDLPDYDPIDDYGHYEKYEPQPAPSPEPAKKIAKVCVGEDEAIGAALSYMEEFPDRVYEVEKHYTGSWKVVYWVTAADIKETEFFTQGLKKFAAQYLYESKIMQPGEFKVIGGSFS